MTWAEEHPNACVRCLGCGQVANSEDAEPWSAWADLPPGSDLAVRAGLVKPVPCPECGGSGVKAAGFVVVRDEDDRMVCDWDGEIHPTRDDAAAELELAKQQEPLYEWYLAEVRPTQTGGQS